MESKLYVGVKGTTREVFRSRETPTQQSHGAKYAAAIGPFRTRAGADFMAAYGHHNNPHLRSVADAERLAKKRVLA
jgi:hypothetical protein